MSERYSTEAIACGLSDVAGWLENEGWIPKHVRQIRLGAERLRELNAAQGIEARSDGMRSSPAEGESPTRRDAPPRIPDEIVEAIQNLEDWATTRGGLVTGGVSEVRAARTALDSTILRHLSAALVRAERVEKAIERLNDLRGWVNEVIAGKPEHVSDDDHIGWLDEGLCETDRRLCSIITSIEAQEKP